MGLSNKGIKSQILDIFNRPDLRSSGMGFEVVDLVNMLQDSFSGMDIKSQVEKSLEELEGRGKIKKENILDSITGELFPRYFPK